MMKPTYAWATLVLLGLMTACSSAERPPSGGAAASPPQAVPPVASAPVVVPAAPAPPQTGAGAAPPPAVKAQAPVPVLSQRRAYALVKQTAEAQQIAQRLGSRMIMGTTGPPDESSYHVSIGENFPERIRFELHFTVNKADGTVRYTDVATGQERLATPLVAPPDPVTAQAEALLGRGETQAAVDLLTKAVAERPAADTWNLLSYAHLISGRWQAAAETGRKALEVHEFHPYALYNTGIAELELKQYPEAVRHLRDATEVQPQRAEPLVGLARAYQESGRHALAGDAAVSALKLAPGDADALKAQAGVGAMISRTAPADLTAAAAARLEDGPYAIYLYPGKSSAMVYLKGPDGVVGLPVGQMPPDTRPRFERADLPGGAVGYFLSGEPLGAYVSHSQAWRLFTLGGGGQFRQVVFIGADDWPGQRVDDRVRSMGSPLVRGDRLEAIYGDDASGQRTVIDKWQLLPAEGKAIRVESTRENRDPRK